MTLGELDLWKLIDHFSVEDAAILIAGGEPHYYKNDQYGWTAEFRAAVDTAETALKRAILKNALRADLAFPAEGYWVNEYIQENLEPKRTWEAIVTAILNDGIKLYSGRGLPPLSELDGLVILPTEPDWERTLIERDDLVAWLASRAIHPPFFFDHDSNDGPKDKRHPRYSEKLACAISAWEAVERPAAHKSVKQTVSAWVRANAGAFNLVDDEGRPVEKAVEEIAKVVNWNPKGGATPSQLPSASEEFESVPIENLQTDGWDTLTNPPF